MYAVKLLRRRNHRDEEYGRILLEGENLKFQGLSSVFQAYLRHGFGSLAQGPVKLSDGLAFLKNIENHHFDACLWASDIVEMPDTNQG